MTFYSPLRYPGGKNKLAKFIALVCDKNYIRGHYVEPYTGGGSVALFLLFNGYVDKITINDFDKSIYAFWFSVLNDTDRLCKKIRRTEIDINNWKKQKRIQKNKDDENDLLKLGFSTLFLNRTNYSGIIDAGPIGGYEQNGKYKLDCRFNKEDIIKKIQFISSHRENIYLENLDALQLIKKIKKNTNTIFYFDPPYYIKGPSLYLNHYKHEDHEKVCKEISSMKNVAWIVSYDNTTQIRNLYQKFRKREFYFNHSAYRSRRGKEILFYSPGLKIPRVKCPTKTLI